MVTKEALEKRLLELRQSLEQITANGNATAGAIAECEYWLKRLNAPDTDKEPKP